MRAIFSFTEVLAIIAGFYYLANFSPLIFFLNRAKKGRKEPSQIGDFGGGEKYKKTETTIEPKYLGMSKYVSYLHQFSQHTD